MIRAPLRVYIALVAASALASATLATDVENPRFARLLSSLLSHSVPEISVPAAKDETGCTWLDTRAMDEFRVSHIPGARHVGDEDFDPAAVDDIDRGACVILYCSIGYRSEKVAERMRSRGFLNVHNLYGGIFEWLNSGQPVVAPDGTATDRIHAYSRTWGIWLTRGEKVY